MGADDREDIGVLVAEVVDHHRTGQGHHRHHHGPARLGRHQRPGDARRRSTSPIGAPGAVTRRLVTQEGRDPPGHRDQGEAGELEAGAREPEPWEGIAPEVTSCQQGAEDAGPRIAPNTAPNSTRAMPGPALRRVHVPGRGPGKQGGAVGGPDAGEAGEHGQRGAPRTAQRGEPAAGGADAEAGHQHRDATQAVHRPAGTAASAPAVARRRARGPAATRGRALGRG